MFHPSDAHLNAIGLLTLDSGQEFVRIGRHAATCDV